MRTVKAIATLITLIFFTTYGIAQDGPNTPLSTCNHPVAHDDCASTPTPSLCELDGYSFGTADYTNDDPIDAYLNGFCGGGSVTHNNMWIGFTALQTSMVLEFEFHGCVGTNPSCKGVQAGIFELDCAGTTFTLLDCRNCVSSSFLVATTALVPGQFYYIMIDGCCGDACDYTLHVLDGLPYANFDVNVTDATLCYDDASLFDVTRTLYATVNPAVPPNGQYEYEWTTDDGNIVSDNDEYSCVVDKIGTYMVTVRENQNCCKSKTTSSVIVSATAPIANAETPINMDCTVSEVELSGSFSQAVGIEYQYFWLDGVGSIVQGSQQQTNWLYDYAKRKCLYSKF